jgi:hypothetical protein
MITIKTLAVLTFAGGLLFSAPEAHAQPRAAARQPAAKENKMAFDIPKSMKAEHDELHSDLAQLTGAGWTDRRGRQVRG